MALKLSKVSVTAELLKLRQCASCSPDLKPGIWYNEFTRVKTYAEANKLPLIAVWTNGDKCGFCVKLEKCFLDPKFIEWQKKSGCIFWLGTSTDTNREDGYHGSGFKWCYNSGAVRFYPFVRVYWPKGGVDKCLEGNSLDRGKNPPSGTLAIIEQLEKLLKAWKPTPAPVPPPKPPVPPAPPAPTPAQKKVKVRFNPEWDQKQIDEFKETIKKNGGHCPCQDPSPDTLCMCKDFRSKGEKDIPEEGLICHCGLYQKYLA